MKSLLSGIQTFVDTVMMEDAKTIAHAYADYYHLGGGSGNLLSYGCFNNYDLLGTLYLKPGVLLNGQMYPFEERNITESIDTAWYSEIDTYEPFETVPYAVHNAQHYCP